MTSRQKIVVLVGAVLMSVAPTASPQDFTEVWAMDSAEIARVADAPLCQALAARRARNLEFPVIDQEISRRGADCSETLARVLGDCEPLHLVRQEPVPGRGTAYYVRNASDHPVQFRINHRGVASTAFEIAPRATQGFGVQTDPLTSMAGRYLNRRDDNSRNVEFFNCVAIGGLSGPSAPSVVKPIPPQ